jgi:seryl-tRNA synthetase
MIDPKIIRQNPDAVRQGLKNRNFPLQELEEYIVLDAEWRIKLTQLEELKHKRNQLVPKGKPSQEQMTELGNISKQIKTLQESVQDLETKTKNLALMLPNIPAKDIPIGNSEQDNVEIRKFGQPKEFPFQPLPHEEIAKNLNILDFTAATKISGSRFVCYKGKGAKLERALINFMLDTHTKEHNYQEIMPPVLVNSNSMLGTGQLPKFAEDSFKIQDTDLWLSPTAEVQLTNLYNNTVIAEEDLPIYLTAYTPCFRREAGSYGKDVSGIIRLHQFNKVELVKLVKPESSSNELEKLLNNAEEILKMLNLPYRVVNLCSGDIGFSATKTYDIEVWFPSQNKYREISSCSNFLDFQARRAMIRYKSSSTNCTEYLHTINGSGLAAGRTFAAILENYQNENGSVSIPEILKPYFEERIIN